MHEETRKVELIIGKILRVGVVTSAVVILIGMALYFMNGNGGYSGDYFPRRFSDIFTGLIQGKAYSVIMLGIFLLILTPVLRVVVSIYAFYKEKDMMYVIITTTVLIILAIAMILGYRS
jgi:Predicted membrane protein